MRTEKGSTSLVSRVRLGGRARRLLLALFVAILISFLPGEGIEGHLASHVENRGNSFSAAAEFSAEP